MPNYTQFGDMAHGSVNVGSAWTKLDITSGTFTFTKESGSTTLEVYVNSRFSIGTLTGGAVQFQVRVDDGLPNFGNLGSIRQSNTSEFLSMFAVFYAPAGPHTVSIWAMAAGGSASSVLVDPGNCGGRIIVKEFV